MMSMLYYIISELCYCYIISVGIRTVCGRRRTDFWVELCSYIGFGVAVNCVYQLINIPILTLAVNMLGLFLVSLNYEGKISSHLFQTLLVTILLVVGETTGMLLTNQTNMHPTERSQVYFDLTLVIIARLIQLCLLILMRMFIKREEKKSFSTAQVIVFSFFVAGSIYLETILFVGLFEKMPDITMITNIVILVLNILVIWIYDNMGRQYLELQKSHLIEKKNAIYKNELAIMKEHESSIRTLRHDMKNHCLVLKEQLKQEEIEEAKKYLNKIIEKTETKGMWIKSGNWEIDSFINYKFAEAQQHNIDCVVQAKIPANLQIDEFLIACVLGNLLDNAITAAKNSQEPKIEVALTYVKQNLHILISNTYKGELIYKNGKLVTQKQNKKNHGYGLESVVHEVQRYQGNIKIDHSEQVFSVSVILPIL